MLVLSSMVESHWQLTRGNAFYLKIAADLALPGGSGLLPAALLCAALYYLGTALPRPPIPKCTC